MVSTYNIVIDRFNRILKWKYYTLFYFKMWDILENLECKLSYFVFLVMKEYSSVCKTLLKWICEYVRFEKIFKKTRTRMHSSRMRTACSLIISHSICHARLPAMHTHCHACPPATHAPLPCMPPCPHAPHHAHPPTTMHTPLPCTHPPPRGQNS